MTDAKAEKDTAPKLQVVTRVIQDDEADLRLDRWLRQSYPNLTQGQIEKLLRTGQIRVDGKRVEGKTRLVAWQSVRLPPLVTSALPPVEGMRRQMPTATRIKRLRDLIIYEDDDVVAINKPAGMAVQGGTGIKKSLDDELLAFALPADENGEYEVPKLVHRLDRETSGVLLLARTAFAARALTASFRLRTTYKYYLALVSGVPEAPAGVVQAPLLKRSDGRVMPHEGGQDAHSDFWVIDRAHTKCAALLLRPRTGRTHQLRVHCELLGCPILGDSIYYDEKSVELAYELEIKTLQLHAWRLQLPHPRQGRPPLDLTASLSIEQQAAWKEFGFSTKLNLDKLLAELDR